jgi:hypothetical protein
MYAAHFCPGRTRSGTAETSIPAFAATFFTLVSSAPQLLPPTQSHYSPDVAPHCVSILAVPQFVVAFRIQNLLVAHLCITGPKLAGPPHSRGKMLPAYGSLALPKRRISDSGQSRTAHNSQFTDSLEFNSQLHRAVFKADLSTCRTSREILRSFWEVDTKGAVHLLK